MLEALKWIYKKKYYVEFGLVSEIYEEKRRFAYGIYFRHCFFGGRLKTNRKKPNPFTMFSNEEHSKQYLEEHYK
jgi:hypothetical protein